MRTVKHLVIEEMQDYTPIQFAALNKVYPDLEFVAMNKSYRSAYEIMDFAKRIGGQSYIEMMERHGERPVVVSLESQQEDIREINRIISTFKERGNAQTHTSCCGKEVTFFYGIIAI